MQYITETRQVPVKESYDVIVIGGGVAGVAAAVAAARLGSKTLLIEKGAYLGGLATLGLIAWYEPLCDGRGHHMIGGLAEELLRISIEYGYDSLPAEWKERRPVPEGKGAPRYATHFSAGMFALALDRLILKNGVDVRFDMVASHPVMDGGHCRGIITESKSGREFFPAKVVVDASGDADILSRAGIPCALGQNYLSVVTVRTSLENCARAVEKQDIMAARSWFGGGSNLWGEGHPEGMHYFTGVTNEEVTEFLLEGRKIIFDKIKDEPRKSRDIVTLPTMAQFRKTRRIAGDYVLREADVYRHFDDSIGAAGDFARPGQRFEIPYRCLYRTGFDNLLAAGRVVSADDRGWEVTRVIPVAAMTGQGAGTAAHLAAQGNAGVDTLEIAKLQHTLTQSGLMLHIPEHLAHADE